MTSNFSTTSGTSTVAAPHQSSSTPVPFEQAITTAQLQPHTPQAAINNNNNNFFEKWGVPIIGMILTGITGYYGALLQLKDNINDNKTEVTVTKKEVEYIKENVKRMETDVGKISNIITDIAIIRTKLEATDNQRKK